MNRSVILIIAWLGLTFGVHHAFPAAYANKPAGPDRVVVNTRRRAGHNYFFGKDQEKKERPRLVHADSLVGLVEEGQELLLLKGHVRLVQGNAQMECKEAKWWENIQRVLLLGDVMIHDGKRTLYAQKVDYDGLTREEKAYGDVLLIAGDRRVKSESLHYSQDTETAVARDQVVVSDLIEQATLFGGWMKYDQKNDYGIVENQPRLVKEDSVSGERLTVEGTRMEIWGEGQRVVITDSVQFWKGDMRAECSRAEYLSSDSVLILEQIPVVWYREQKITGDTVTVQLEGVTFRRSHIRGNAKIVALDTSARDILEGGEIFIDAAYTDEDTIQTITVEGQASSLYHVKEQDEEQSGVNHVTGDRLVLIVIGDRLQSVEVQSIPGQSTGVYTPNGLKQPEKPVPDKQKKQDNP